MIYRHVSQSDYEQVALMMHNLYREDPGQNDLLKDHPFKTFQEFTMNPEKGVVMVMEENGEVVGYAILIFFWSNEFGSNTINIDELYVAKHMRGKGAATGFIRYLIEQKIGNSTVLDLEVTPTNTRARSLYEKIGFKPWKNTFMRYIIE